MGKKIINTKTTTYRTTTITTNRGSLYAFIIVVAILGTIGGAFHFGIISFDKILKLPLDSNGGSDSRQSIPPATTSAPVASITDTSTPVASITDTYTPVVDTNSGNMHLESTPNNTQTFGNNSGDNTLDNNSNTLDNNSNTLDNNSNTLDNNSNTLNNSSNTLDNNSNTLDSDNTLDTLDNNSNTLDSDNTLDTLDNSSNTLDNSSSDNTLDNSSGDNSPTKYNDKDRRRHRRLR